MARTRVRSAWGLAAILAGAILAGAGLVLRPYWTLRYQSRLADLHGATLVFAPVSRVVMVGVNLRHANLRRANLQSAGFGIATVRSPLTGHVSFRRSDLTGADLTKANMNEITMEHTVLRGACLRRASLRGADLGQTDLRDADLSGADLAGASLWEADLFGTKLTSARYNRDTIWPTGFSPQQHGAVRVNYGPFRYW